MQFLINFKGQDGEEISGTFPHGFGLNMVKEIRLEGECPNLPLECIQGIVYPVSVRAVRVNVEEKLADKSGHFLYNEMIEVVVPLAGLRGFYQQKTIICRSSVTQEATYASVEWILNEAAVLAAWEDDGCPLNWNTDN